MPIYEYSCQECGRQFEKLVNAGTEVRCPACSGSRVMRLLSLFGARTQGRFATTVPGGPPAGGGGGCCAGGCGCS